MVSNGEASISVGVVGFGKPEDGDEERRTGLALFRTMAFIRQYEQLSQSLFRRGAIAGAVHLAMGQEAVPTGVCSMLQPDDLVTATYRGHGQALALGVDPLGLLAEMLGRKSGLCGGRAGSMNVVDRAHGLIGCFAIVGGSIAAATGAALSCKHRGVGVAVAFFGDGAANQGYFAECLNFAAVLELPIVYVCENNRYGEFTPTEKVTPGGILARPRAMNIASNSVDGNDVWAVREAASEALERARSGKGPAFVEARTYRYNDHARGDPVSYRPEGEMEEWLARDPLLVARARLVSDLGVSEQELDLIMADVNEGVEAIRVAAMEAPFPDPAERGREFKDTNLGCEP